MAASVVLFVYQHRMRSSLNTPQNEEQVPTTSIPGERPICYEPMNRTWWTPPFVTGARDSIRLRWALSQASASAAAMSRPMLPVRACRRFRLGISDSCTRENPHKRHLPILRCQTSQILEQLTVNPMRIGYTKTHHDPIYIPAIECFSTVR